MLKPRKDLLEKYIQQWLKILRVWAFLLGAILPAMGGGGGRKCYEASHVSVLLSVSHAIWGASQKQLRIADMQYAPSV